MTQVVDIPNVRLNDGHEIPQLGFGVFQVPPDDTERAVALALEAGYRHIDTAAAYGNEEGVGRALDASGLRRDEFLVTTKVWNDSQGRERTVRSLDKSLRRLGLDYVDLYLIHWPAPHRDLYVETWQALETVREDGRARSIGVSNFTREHLERLAGDTNSTPALNQIELHPRFQQRELRRFHADHGIVTEAWSPLAQGDVVEDPAVAELASAHGRTPAQVVLRWHLQLGNVVIPKSATPARIEENSDIFDFALDDDAMHTLDGLDAGERIGPDPATFAA
jgi:2,5-diketo-D-gluconate reductase A